MKPTKPLRRGLERDGAVVSSFPKLDLDHLLETLADHLTARLEPRLNNDSGIAPRLLTVDQAATYLGRSKNAVQHMVAARKLPVVRDGHRVFLDVRELDKWIEGSTEPAEF